MLIRHNRVFITSIDTLGKKGGYPDTTFDSGVVINYSNTKDPSAEKTRFAELSSTIQNKDIVKKLEQSLLDNTPVNLVILTNEKNPTMFDRIEKVEFL